MRKILNNYGTTPKIQEKIKKGFPHKKIQCDYIWYIVGIWAVNGCYLRYFSPNVKLKIEMHSSSLLMPNTKNHHYTPDAKERSQSSPLQGVNRYSENMEDDL